MVRESQQQDKHMQMPCRSISKTHLEKNREGEIEFIKVKGKDISVQMMLSLRAGRPRMILPGGSSLLQQGQTPGGSERGNWNKKADMIVHTTLSRSLTLKKGNSNQDRQMRVCLF